MKKTLLVAGAALMLTSTAALAERSGEEIYNTKCSVCHAAGVAGAPKFGNADEWGPRAAKGIDALLAVSLTGVNAMPPKGTCMDCSESEMKAAIQYMLDAAK